MKTMRMNYIEEPRKYTSAIKRSLYIQGILIWGLAVIFYSFDNLLNVAPSGMKPQLSQFFNISAAKLGILSSCYLWAYGVMQLPAGVLMDSIGPRRVLSIAGISCAFGTLLFAVATNLETACIGRVFIGLGASVSIVGCCKIAAVWFPPRRFALLMGMTVAIGMLGGAFGVAFISKIITNYGWQHSLFTGAAIMLIISGLMWVLIRDKPPIEINPTQETSTVPIMQGLQEVLTCPQSWYAAIYAGLMFVPTLAFGGLWGTPYLVEAHGFSQADAGLLSSLIFVGWGLGGPIYGWISDYIGKRNPPMYFANISTLIICLWLIYGSNFSFFSLSIGMFLLGFCSSGFPIAFVVTRENNRPEISGTAIGFMNTMNTFSVAIFQFLIGWILELVSSNVIITASGRSFSLLDYKKALTCIPICLVFAMFAMQKIKETNCIVKHHD